MILGVLPFVYAWLVPTPFEYVNWPFQVCAPDSTSADDCRPPTVFHPGEVVPFIVERCVDNRFASGIVLPYVVSRNLRTAESGGPAVILDQLSTSVSIDGGGCSRALTQAHALPPALPDGRWYLEGVATVYGRFRTVNSYFRTETFTVEGDHKGNQLPAFGELPSEVVQVSAK